LFSFYADDAAVLPANGEMITNKAGATKFWSDHLTPNVDVSWTPMYVESAKAGDLVYDLGSYTMTTRPAKGKGAAVTDHGKYLAVWKKQADGSWKAEADTWNSDKPLPGAKS
jgi:ketosteroid isomerase-like protein